MKFALLLYRVVMYYKTANAILIADMHSEWNFNQGKRV